MMLVISFHKSEQPDVAAGGVVMFAVVKPRHFRLVHTGTIEELMLYIAYET